MAEDDVPFPHLTPEQISEIVRRRLNPLPDDDITRLPEGEAPPPDEDYTQ